MLLAYNIVGMIFALQIRLVVVLVACLLAGLQSVRLID